MMLDSEKTDPISDKKRWVEPALEEVRISSTTNFPLGGPMPDGGFTGAPLSS